MPEAVTLTGRRVRLEPLALSHVAALVLAASESRDSSAHARAVDGSVRDTAYYSITAPEWPAVRAALTARVNGSAR
jgi:hypothetical protein